ncbi:MAG: agmatinase [Ignavibacteria bacterium GWF2_33_9]|nr:MAG: agmatinase [Ignavibacteria bacterium GWF2_33_9]
MITLPEESNFLAIEEKVSTYSTSKIVIVQAPYEHTVSYGGGAALGPKEIVNASAYVEFYDDEFDKELCFEKGIATLEPIDFQGKVDAAALELIYNQISTLLSDDKFVVTLGGEHTISSAPIKAHYEKYPNMSVLQFDAHSDLRESYQDSIYSHASIMARVAEFFPNEHITQVGIRAQCIEEAMFIKENNINTFYASGIRTGKYGNDWIKKLVDTLADEVYITFDVDAFDPAIMPTTGTPEPDGMTYQDALNIFRAIRIAGKKIIGFDVVELAPVEGINHTNLTCARLVYKLLNYAFYDL